MCKRRADAYARQWQHSHFSTYQLMTMAYESGYVAGMCRRDDIIEERKKDEAAVSATERLPNG